MKRDQTVVRILVAAALLLGGCSGAVSPTGAKATCGVSMPRPTT
jgi:hypothetical protein